MKCNKPDLSKWKFRLCIKTNPTYQIELNRTNTQIGTQTGRHADRHRHNNNNQRLPLKELKWQRGRLVLGLHFHNFRTLCCRTSIAAICEL